MSAPTTPDPIPDEATHYLRVAFAAALVQSGYLDQDEDGDIEVTQWHPCEPTCGKCGCSGIPYVSDAVWSKIDKFGYLTKAVEVIRAPLKGEVDRLNDQILDMQGDRPWR